MPKKETASYSYENSLQMLNKLQQMAIDEGNINLALKAEELKCKVVSMQANIEDNEKNDDLTKILVDFINGKQNSKNTGNICSSAEGASEI